MGLSPYHAEEGIKSQPDPTRWELHHLDDFPCAYVLQIRYLDCTNYEGRKILVFRKGQKGSQPYLPTILDPHFQSLPHNFCGDRLIGRFPPTEEGYGFALTMAKMISETP